MSDAVLSLERFGLDDYFKNELKFWKSMRAFYGGKESKIEVPNSLIKRYDEEFFIEMAQKRFTNMAKIIKLFKDEHIQDIIDGVYQKCDIKLDKDFNLEDIKTSIQKTSTPPAWGWPEVIVIIIVIIVVVIAEHYDHKGKGEEDPTIATAEVSFLQGLVDEDKSLTSDEIEGLSYSAWVTYLNMCLIMENIEGYLIGLMFGSCGNLRLYLEAYNNDVNRLFPEDTHWLAYLFVVAKLMECEIEYY